MKPTSNSVKWVSFWNKEISRVLRLVWSTPEAILEVKEASHDLDPLAAVCLGPTTRR